MNKTAYDELTEALDPEKTIKAIVFGDWGWGGYNEVEDPIPEEIRGKPMTFKAATPYLKHWKICGGFGSPNCYAIYAWTQQRVFLIGTYDGSTWLSSVPRNPIECTPMLIGGG